MASGKGRKVNYLISTILLAFFLYLAFRNVNLTELADILKSTNYLYVVIGVAWGVIMSSVVRCWRWAVLLEPVKKGILFKNLFSSTMIGYMVNNLVPRSGEFVRPYLLGKSENISKASAFGTIIIERIVDTITFLIMFGLALLYFKNRISNAFPEIGSAIVFLIIIIILLLLWILFSMFRTEQSMKIVKFLTKILPSHIRHKADDIFTSLIDGFEVLKKPSLLFKIALYSALLWGVYLLSTYIPFYSFGIFVNGNSSLWSNLWNANLLLVMINVSMFIPSPAATGPYHYVCKVTLVSVFSINEATALGYATATHMVNFLIFLIFGLYYFIKLQYKISELKEETV